MPSDLQFNGIWSTMELFVLVWAIVGGAVFGFFGWQYWVARRKLKRWTRRQVPLVFHAHPDSWLPLRRKTEVPQVDKLYRVVRD